MKCVRNKILKVSVCEVELKRKKKNKLIIIKQNNRKQIKHTKIIKLQQFVLYLRIVMFCPLTPII